jgi:hypothetical protein
MIGASRKAIKVKNWKEAYGIKEIIEQPLSMARFDQSFHWQSLRAKIDR